MIDVSVMFQSLLFHEGCTLGLLACSAKHGEREVRTGHVLRTVFLCR